MGRHVRVRGRVLDGQGEPVSDAMVEVWQADGEGRYRHPLTGWFEQVRGSFVGFGRVATDDDGRWEIDTVVPGPVPGPDGSTQAPHVNVQVFARGLLDLLCTRIYFAGEAANDADPVLSSVPADRRDLLVAQPDDSSDAAAWRFDIVLRGEAETPFFEV
jgi:protocatechuate 3,4-dioxygenase alpha subunit